MTKLKKENVNGSRWLMNFTSHLKRNLIALLPKSKRFVSKMNQPGLTVKFAVHQWLLRWGGMVSFTLAVVFRNVEIQKPLQRKLELNVRNASKAKSLNENQRKTGSFMVVRGIRIVILFHGICRLDVIVRKMDTIWYTKRVARVGKLYVQTVIMKNQLKNRSQRGCDGCRSLFLLKKYLNRFFEVNLLKYWYQW